MTTTSAQLNRKDLFLRACRGETLPRLPVWMMRQAGRYLPEYRAIRANHAFLEVCKTPDLAVEVSLQPFRLLGVDAVIVFSDILIPAEAMGLKLELGDAGPNLPEPVRSKRDVDKLQLFDPEIETGFLPEAIRRIVREIGPTVPVLGFAAAPWTLACYMVEGRTQRRFRHGKEFSAPRAGDVSQSVASHRAGDHPLLKSSNRRWCGCRSIVRHLVWRAVSAGLRRVRSACNARDHLRPGRLCSRNLLHESLSPFAACRGALRRQCSKRRLARGSARASRQARPTNCPAGKCRSRSALRPAGRNSPCHAGSYAALGGKATFSISATEFCSTLPSKMPSSLSKRASNPCFRKPNPRQVCVRGLLS